MGGITIRQNPMVRNMMECPFGHRIGCNLAHYEHCRNSANTCLVLRVAGNAVDALLHDDLRVQQNHRVVLMNAYSVILPGYKSATLIRHTATYQCHLQSVGLNEYLAFLTSSDSEAEFFLANDLLISVTAFFAIKRLTKALWSNAQAIQYGSRGFAFGLPVVRPVKKPIRWRSWCMKSGWIEIKANVADICYRHWWCGPWNRTTWVISGNCVKELSQELVERYFNKRGAYYEIIKPLRDAIVLPSII